MSCCHFIIIIIPFPQDFEFLIKKFCYFVVPSKALNTFKQELTEDPIIRVCTKMKEKSCILARQP